MNAPSGVSPNPAATAASPSRERSGAEVDPDHPADAGPLEQHHDQALTGTPRRRPRATSGPVGEPPTDELLDGYRCRLERSAVAASTRTAYLRHARRYLAWLDTRPAGERARALTDPAGRDWAVRDWGRHLAEHERLAPATINASLAGVDDLYRHLQLGPARRVTRQRLPQAAPRALDVDQLRRLLRAVESRGDRRDRAVIALMAFAGLRVSEVAALDRQDVAVTARTGRVTIRSGKGGHARQVPLPAEARSALSGWLDTHPGAGPLFPGPDGRPLNVRSLHRSVTAVASAAGIACSPHALRHTYVTRLVRQGIDLPLVADLAGHRRLETTRRYALPSDTDRQAAVETIHLDY